MIGSRKDRDQMVNTAVSWSEELRSIKNRM